MVEHKCPNLKFCPRFSIASKKKRANGFQMTYFIRAIFKQKLLFNGALKYDYAINVCGVPQTLLHYKMSSIGVGRYPRKM